jgi:hypothetical protein
MRMYHFYFFSFSDAQKDSRAEEDDETMEWEREQLRRGHLKDVVSDQVSAKQIYKAAPSRSELTLCRNVTYAFCSSSPSDSHTYP